MVEWIRGEGDDGTEKQADRSADRISGDDDTTKASAEENRQDDKI